MFCQAQDAVLHFGFTMSLHIWGSPPHPPTHPIGGSIDFILFSEEFTYTTHHHHQAPHHTQPPTPSVDLSISFCSQRSFGLPTTPSRPPTPSVVYGPQLEVAESITCFRISLTQAVAGCR